MQCPNCATILADESWTCSRCGYPVRPKHHVVHLDFAGSPLQVLLWILLLALVSIRISLPPGINIRILSVNVPPPWTTDAPPWLLLAWSFSLLLGVAGVWIFEAACRWFCRHLQFSDDSRADFSGRAVEIIGWWLLWVIVGHTASLPAPAGPLIGIILFFVNLWCSLNILRWFVAHVELTSNRRFAFQGSYRELLGWEVLLAFSVFTIIGWAWALAAMYRWMAASTTAPDATLHFHGLGHQILWRTLAAVLFSIPILTIPWVWLWYTRWLVDNTTIEGQLGTVAL